MTFFLKYRNKFFGYLRLVLISFFQLFIVSWETVWLRVFPYDIQDQGDHHMLIFFGVIELNGQRKVI